MLKHLIRIYSYCGLDAEFIDNDNSNDLILKIDFILSLLDETKPIFMSTNIFNDNNHSGMLSIIFRNRLVYILVYHNIYMMIIQLKIKYYN